VLGNLEPLAFPPIEMDYSGMPEGMPHVLDAKAKWDEKSPEYKGTKAVLADLSDEMRARLQQAALAAYRALRVRDYGRIDLRLTEAGDVYVIEVNASYEADWSLAARRAGGLDSCAGACFRNQVSAGSKVQQREATSRHSLLFRDSLEPRSVLVGLCGNLIRA
jgi:hypothetical protein